MATRSRDDRTGIILVDHGSRREASNQMLLAAARLFQESSGQSIVEPAHMELALPDIATAFNRCVARGAERVVVFPYFLSPGRHWSEDIPHLVSAAAQDHPQVEWIVTAPFGLHPRMSDIIQDRIDHCLRAAESAESVDCDVCDGNHCRLQGGNVPPADL